MSEPSDLNNPHHGLCMVFLEDQLLMRRGVAGVVFPTWNELKDCIRPESQKSIALVSDGFTVMPWEPGQAAPSDYIWEPLRGVFMRASVAEIEQISRARQLLHWTRDHQFCGRCGLPTVPIPNEMAKGCQQCGLLNYPRLSPCVMVAVIQGDELLLGRSPHFRSGMYSVLAGFVEAGETLEAAAAREVFEESGVRIKNLTYFGSQSWPFPHSLMLALYAEYDSGKLCVDHRELEDARWFKKDLLRTCPDLLPSEISISRQLIDYLLQGP